MHASAPATPPGFLYLPELISADEERRLLGWFEAAADWNAITFRGQTARRRAMAFGARYLAQGRSLVAAPPLPPVLAGIRDRMVTAAAAGLGPELALAGRSAADFALGTALDYPPGAAIGWHTDNRAFGPTVLCLSLGSAARLQLKPVAGPALVERVLAPRSLFVLAGEVRTSWQHRILPVRARRHSFTVRAPAAHPPAAPEDVRQAT